MSTPVATEWNSFIAACPGGSFLQSWQWGELQRLHGVPFWRLESTYNGQPAAKALVVKRHLPGGKSWLYIPRGPVFAAGITTMETQYREVWQDLQKQLRHIAAEQAAIFMRFEPVDTIAGWPATRRIVEDLAVLRSADHDIQPRHTAIVDLRPEPETLLAAMHSKTRYNIRLAEKRGVTIRFSQSSADLALFLRLAHGMMRRTDFRFHPASYYEAMLKAFTTDGTAATNGLTIELVVAERAGEVLAVLILLSFAGTTTYVHGASSDVQRSVMAPYLTHWQAMLRARTRGDQSYDFFGVAPLAAPADHPWSGITRFKLGFGGQRKEYPGACDIVLDRSWYRLVQFARRVRDVLP